MAGPVGLAPGREPLFSLRCSQFNVGDAVYALSNTYVPYSEYEGTYAEYALVKEEWLAHAPSSDALSLKHAAGVPLVALTAMQALEKAEKAVGGLKSKRILVLGASGGVGQFGAFALRWP